MCKECCSNCVYYDTECYNPICTNEDVCGGCDYIVGDPDEEVCSAFESAEGGERK